MTVKVLSICTLLVLLVSGCADSEMTELIYKKEVEISPGKWLLLEKRSYVPSSDLEPRTKNPHELSPLDAIKQLTDSSSSSVLEKSWSAFTLDWNEKKVTYKGKGIPVTLREHDNTLYMIGFNRRDLDAVKLVFFKLNDKGTKFVTIKASNFPRQIATQNMWLSPSGRFVNCNGEIVDTWEVLRNLDISAPIFSSRFTAHMWYQIETGTEYHKISYVDLNEKFIKEYVEKYKPIALPTIVKEKK